MNQKIAALLESALNLNLKRSRLRNHTVQVDLNWQNHFLVFLGKSLPGLCANSFCTLLARSPFHTSFTYSLFHTHMHRHTSWQENLKGERKLYHPQRSGSHLSTEDESSAPLHLSLRDSEWPQLQSQRPGMLQVGLK